MSFLAFGLYALSRRTSHHQETCGLSARNWKKSQILCRSSPSASLPSLMWIIMCICDLMIHVSWSLTLSRPPPPQGNILFVDNPTPIRLSLELHQFICTWTANPLKSRLEIKDVHSGISAYGTEKTYHFTFGTWRQHSMQFISKLNYYCCCLCCCIYPPWLWLICHKHY